MTNAELIATIRNEIERMVDEYKPIVGGVDELTGAHIVLAKLLSFLDSLESEKPMNPNDAMKELDEKIALVKQRGTWDGVDVDKYMDEVRGREPEKPMELDEEIKRFVAEYGYERSEDILLIAIVARHFSEWGAEHTPLLEDTVLFNKGVAEGRRLAEEEQADLFTIVALDAAQRAKEQMLKDGNVILTEEDFEAEKEKSMEWGYNLCKEQMMKESVEGLFQNTPFPTICLDDCKDYNFKDNQKVRIIIVKEDEK